MGLRVEPQYDWQTIQSSPEYWDLNSDQRAIVKSEWWKRYVETSEELKAYTPEQQKTARERFLQPEDYVPYERGFLGDVASRAARGGIGLIESVGGAMRMADADPTRETGIIAKTGKRVSEFAKKTREESDFLKPDISEATGAEGFVKRGFGGAVESAIPSLAPLAGTIAGAKVGGVLGTAIGGPAGTIPGAIIGGGIGGIGTLFATFGLGEYQTTYDDTVEELTRNGVSPEEADIKARKNAFVAATAETGGELVGDLAAMTFFGVIGAQAAKQPLKQTIRQLIGAGKVGFAKAVVKTVPFEVGSEMGTAYFQAKAAQEAGVSTLPPAEAVAEAVLPAVFLSLMFGGAVHGMNEIEARNIFTGLNDKDPIIRIRSAEIISGRIKDPVEKQEWAKIASNYIDSGEQMPLDKPIIDFAIQKKDDDGGQTSDILGATTVDEAIDAFKETTKPGLFSTHTAEEGAQMEADILRQRDPLYEARKRIQQAIDVESAAMSKQEAQRAEQQRQDALKAAGLVRTSGEIPGQGVDQAQQRKELARRMGLPVQEDIQAQPLALPPGQGFEVVGDQPRGFEAVPSTAIRMPGPKREALAAEIEKARKKPIKPLEAKGEIPWQKSAAIKESAEEKAAEKIEAIKKEDVVSEPAPKAAEPKVTPTIPIPEKAPEAAAAVKEPWEMTISEWDVELKNRRKAAIEKWNTAGAKGFPPGVMINTVKQRIDLAEKAGYDLPKEASEIEHMDFHELSVRAAIKQGKIKSHPDYPDLSRTIDKTTAKIHQIPPYEAAKPVTKKETSLDEYIEQVKSKNLSGIKIEKQIEIEETGQVVTAKKDAAKLMRDVDKKIEAYEKLLDCLS